MKMFDLCPTKNDGRKSFYGKAKVIIKDNGETVLKSYDTEVCKLNSNGEFIRLWNEYSPTTMRHVNSFLEFVGVKGGGKKWWNAQSVQN